MINPAFAARVQASLSKTALPSYLNELDSGEQYEEGYTDGTQAHKSAPAYEEGFDNGSDGTPRTKFNDYH